MRLGAAGAPNIHAARRAPARRLGALSPSARILWGAMAEPLPTQIAPDLEAEIGGGPPWMYPWNLTSDRATPVLGSELPSIHRTRMELIEPLAREALAGAAGAPAAVDLACNEGWFAHHLLAWGAERVVGIDIRADTIRRAELLRRHYAIGPDRLELRAADVYELDEAQLGSFDVTLVLGLIYHLENPIGALRIARRLTRGTCIVESQLTAHDEPIRHGWGVSDHFLEAPGHWAARFEPSEEQAENPLASHGGVSSLIPNRAALVEAMSVAGFRDVEVLAARPGHNAQYVDGHRAIVVGRV